MPAPLNAKQALHVEKQSIGVPNATLIGESVIENGNPAYRVLTITYEYETESNRGLRYAVYVGTSRTSAVSGIIEARKKVA